LELPAALRKRRGIAPGMTLRVTEVGDGFYVTRDPDPSMEELRAVLAAAGSLKRSQTPAEEADVLQVIAAYRKEKPRG
jgi:bifunctional DNA-binding transcriptional regulator/antitoxin component of YhaV-PrlF toxin-antitoxin module